MLRPGLFLGNVSKLMPFMTKLPTFSFESLKQTFFFFFFFRSQLYDMDKAWL